MGASPLFPLFVAIFFMGIGALVGLNHHQIRQTELVEADGLLQAGTFLHYKSVVTMYARDNPAFRGTMSAALLTSRGIPAPVQERISHTVVTSASGRALLVYANLPGRAWEIYRDAEHDASLGVVTGGRLQPYNVGAAAVSLPAGVVIPNGYTASYIELGSL